MAKLDCPECGGNLFLMAKRQKDKPSWRCCTRPTHVFVMEAGHELVPVAVRAANSDDHRDRLAEEIHRGCSDDADLLRRLGDL